MDLVRELRLAGVTWTINPTTEISIYGEHSVLFDLVSLEVNIPGKEPISRVFMMYDELSVSEMLADSIKHHSINPDFDLMRDYSNGNVPIEFNFNLLDSLGDCAPVYLISTCDETLEKLGILLQIHEKHLAPMWERAADEIKRVAVKGDSIEIRQLAETSSLGLLPLALNDILLDNQELTRKEVIDLSTAKVLLSNLTLTQWRRVLSRTQLSSQ